MEWSNDFNGMVEQNQWNGWTISMEWLKKNGR